MAITETVYSAAYPNNTKQVVVDVTPRIPVGGDGDNKYIIWVYASTGAYTDNVARTPVNPIFLYEIRRGWAQSFNVNSPINTGGGGTLTVAIDEADGGAVSLAVAGGTLSGQTVAQSLESQLQAVASGTGVKVSAANKLGYLNSQVTYEDGRFLILSGSTKSSYNDSSNWSNTSSVKVTGGTLANALGFTIGYQNSFSLATSASGVMQEPRSAHGNIDEAIKWAVMSIANQIDYSS
jgi:hypothetical protein